MTGAPPPQSGDLPERYGHLYGPAAVVAFAATFAPVHAGRVVLAAGDDIVVDYDSVWAELGGPHPALAVLSLLLSLTLVGLLLAATFRPPGTPVLPLVIGVTALVVVAVLAAEVVGSATELSSAGALTLGTASLLAVTGLAHAVDLGRRRAS